MKSPKNLLMVLAVTAIASWSIAISAQTPPVLQQSTPEQSTALERGYRTGYSDGYNAGFRDIADRVARDYQNKEEYRRGDRSYNEAWGTAEDYRDGYQQGFEAGYSAGYDRRSFDSTLPTALMRRGTADAGATNAGSAPNYPETTTDNPISNTNINGAGNAGPLFLPRDAVLVVELMSPVSTDVSQIGDRFQARVVEPGEFAGATVEGRVTRVKRPGKVKGSGELQLSFESIRTADNRSASIHADVVGIVDMGNRDGAGTVDEEGGVKGKDSTRDDVSKVGAATGIGAVIGAIFGGGKGAAIGAAVGGSVGTAGVLSQRGKDVRLEQGQRLRIRTSTEARIQ